MADRKGAELRPVKSERPSTVLIFFRLGGFEFEEGFGLLEFLC